MKKTNKILLLLVLFICTLLVGCGARLTNTENTKVNIEAKNSENDNNMRTITDMCGRNVKVPLKITKVYCSGQPGVLIMHNINLDKLAGWCFDLRDYEKKYLDPKYYDLPVIGAIQGKNGTVNREQLLSYNPQIILSMEEITETSSENADKLTSDLGIPVIVVDANLKNLDKSYDFLGELLDEKETTDKLAEYCRNTMKEVEQIINSIPEEKKKTVFYAGGEKGLETGGIGSWHTELIDYAGGKNVADFTSGTGRGEVSLEQVLNWNPEVIVEAVYDNNIEGIFNSAEWQGIKAVQDRQVYSAPDEPYNWFDTPPSSNRIIGIKWLVSVLYPDYSNFDMKKEVKDYYKLFYKVDISEDQAEKLLDTKVF